MQNIVNSAVEKRRDIILAAQEYIWKNPETGYREVKTSKYMASAFEDLGYTLTYAEGIPGFYTVVDTCRPGPEVAVFAELDALICPEHPEADPSTGAVHCCGHSAQCAAILGVAAALREKEILDALSGRIRLIAVPAEELIEIEYRTELKRRGVIGCFGGKAEFMRRGYLDGVDIAFMVHTTQGKDFYAMDGSVGCIAKRAVYKGKAAHAGGAPWMGVNVLYAANLGLNAINAIRETFREQDVIRVHPIITNGGNAVNAIPNRVVLESFVRGAEFDAIRQANCRVNRALSASALALGANVEIVDTAGYAPLVNAPGMIELSLDAAKYVPDAEMVYEAKITSGSTDMGDVSAIMPVIHPYAPGASGTSHGADYRIENPELACVASAKWQVHMLRLLLENRAERANKIKAEFTPRFSSAAEYFEYVSSLESSGDRIEYTRDSAQVRL